MPSLAVSQENIRDSFLINSYVHMIINLLILAHYTWFQQVPMQGIVQVASYQIEGKFHSGVLVAMWCLTVSGILNFGLSNLALGPRVKLLKVAQSPMCQVCLLYTSPSPRDKRQPRMPSSA